MTVGTQSHPSAAWRESAGSGAVPSVALGKLVNVPPRMGFEWNAGDPLPYGLAFTGDANRTKIDASGVVRTVAANVPRNDGYVYDKNGLLVPAWLIEAAAINGLLHSEQFDAWSAVGATVSANAATAPDGNATADKIIDSSNAALQFLFQTAAIPNDGGPVTVSIWLKAGTSHIACVELDLFNGTGVNGTVIVDLNAGTIINGVAPTRSSITPFPNGWYRVSVTVTNNTSGNTGAQVVIYPAFAASQTPVSNATVTGDVYAWGAQVETNPVPTSYIPTTSATVLRAGETASVPWGFVPSASVMYATFVEVGGALVNGGGIIAIGDATNFLLLSSPGGVGVYNANYTFFPTSNLAAPVLGDVVELRAVLTAAGGISAGQSLDGAAETTTSTVAGPALPVAWHSPRLSLCGAAGLVAPTVVAFQSIRLALGNWSMDQMRKLAVDPNRSTFSPTGTPTGSLVSNARGYAVTPGDLTGTGKVAFVRNGAKGVIY